MSQTAINDAHQRTLNAHQRSIDAHRRSIGHILHMLELLGERIDSLQAKVQEIEEKLS